MTKVVVLGSGGQARVVIEIVRAMKDHEIVGVTTADEALQGTFFGVPVLGTDRVLPELLREGILVAAVGVGGYTSNTVRRAVFNHAKELGFVCLTAIHPSAVIAPSARIGEGSVICSGAIIQTRSVIGRNVIVGTGSIIDHDTVINDHALVSAGVTIGANVTVGEEALLAIGSTVVTGATIGTAGLVAAGAVVVGDVGDRERVFGIPARPRPQ